jgi:choline dehydrogenase-like flavoprotein
MLRSRRFGAMRDVELYRALLGLTDPWTVAINLFKSAGYFVFAPPMVDTNWHLVGTARMGDDPRTSVVDQHCKAHDVDGFYVVDASALPTAGALNTALTIAAVALRAAAAAPLPR